METQEKQTNNTFELTPGKDDMFRTGEQRCVPFNATVESYEYVITLSDTEREEAYLRAMTTLSSAAAQMFHHTALVVHPPEYYVLNGGVPSELLLKTAMETYDSGAGRRESKNSLWYINPHVTQDYKTGYLLWEPWVEDASMCAGYVMNSATRRLVTLDEAMHKRAFANWGCPLNSHLHFLAALAPEKLFLPSRPVATARDILRDKADAPYDTDLPDLYRISKNATPVEAMYRTRLEQMTQRLESSALRYSIERHCAQPFERLVYVQHNDTTERIEHITTIFPVIDPTYYDKLMDEVEELYKQQCMLNTGGVTKLHSRQAVDALWQTLLDRAKAELEFFMGTAICRLANPALEKWGWIRKQATEEFVRINLETGWLRDRFADLVLYDEKAHLGGLQQNTMLTDEGNLQWCVYVRPYPKYIDKGRVLLHRAWLFEQGYLY